uniref:NAM-associated domain-containing protein n=1 Tax=Heterorhabditis bacteriophora TaxID=37862 RepID=A0A1I7XGS9_HETBA
MAVNIFKSSYGSLSDSDRELSKAGIFPPGKYMEETLIVIAEAIIQIRSFVGIKQFYEASATAWGTIKNHASAIADRVVIGSVKTNTRSYIPNEIQWLEADKELRPTSKVQYSGPNSYYTSSLHEELVSDHNQVKQQAVKLSNVSANKPAPLRTSGPSYCQQVVVQTKAEADMRREIRKEQKRAKKELNRIHHAFGEEEKLELELAQKEILRQRQLEIDQLKWNPTLKSIQRTHELFPFVFDARLDSGSTMITINGMKV